MNVELGRRLIGPLAIMASSAAGASGDAGPWNAAQWGSGYTTTTGFLDLRYAVGLGSSDQASGAGGLKSAIDTGYKGRGRFELDHQWDAARLVVSADLEVQRQNMRGAGDENDQAARLWESYLEVETDAVVWRLGRQVIQWGVADEVSVIDSFTPQDFRHFLVQSRFERKWPVTAVSGKYALNAKDFIEVVWLPRFREDLLARPGDEWSLFVENNYVRGLGLRERSSATDDGRLGDSVFAVRSVTRRDTFDFSLNYAYHFEQLAAFEADIEGVDGNGRYVGTVQPYHARQQTFSMAFETGREGIGLRGELAYVTDSGYVSYDMSVPGLVERRDTVRAVAGIDYTFASRTYINVQYTADYIENHNKMMQPDKLRSSITWRANIPLVGEDVWLEFQGREFLNMTDRFMRLQVRWRVSDDWEVRAGGLHFAGADEGIFGQFRDNDQLYAGVHYFF